MNYFYRIKGAKKSVGHSSVIVAGSLDDAFNKLKERFNIVAVKEYYNGGLYDGLEWRRYWAVDGCKVSIEFSVPLPCNDDFK